jgi:hypothetical protein
MQRFYLHHFCCHFACIMCFAWLFASCAPTRFVKPLKKGQTAITASLGGPLILYGKTTIPVPLTSIAIGHGYENNITGFAGLHTTALLFGVLQTDIGMVKQLHKQDGWVPGISISPVLNLMIDKWQGKLSVFPEVDAHAYWSYSKRQHYAYVGISNWFDLNTKRSEGDVQKTHWFPVLQLGNTIVRPKWSYSLEVKYAPHINSPVVVDFQGLGYKTAIGAYFGVTRNLFANKMKHKNN